MKKGTPLRLKIQASNICPFEGVEGDFVPLVQLRCGTPDTSTNFMLLGLVLAQSAGADDWTDYDQRAVWQNSSTGSPIQLNFTNFAIHGPWSNFTPLHVSHFSARHWLDVCSAVS
jgi:hypothetical protein